MNYVEICDLAECKIYFEDLFSTIYLEFPRLFFEHYKTSNRNVSILQVQVPVPFYTLSI